MGYTTDSSGSFKFSRPLTEKERDYINLLGNTRRGHALDKIITNKNINKLKELLISSKIINKKHYELNDIDIL